MNISERITNLNQFYEDKKDELVGKKMTLKAHEIAVTRFEEQVGTRKDSIELNEKSIVVLNNLVDSKTEDVLNSLKETINGALQVVPLTNDYDIYITENETKRSGKELQIKLLDKEANKTRGLRTSSGTAVAQLVSFIMRIVLISFSDSRKILVVDENFSGFQDKETINIFGAVLVALAEKEGFQIIMVEHKSEFLNVPHIKNVMLRKDSYREGVIVENILDAEEYE